MWLTQRLQFRIRTLFAVTLLIATFLGGWNANDFYRQSASVDPAVKLGVGFLNRNQNSDADLRQLAEIALEQHRLEFNKR